MHNDLIEVGWSESQWNRIVSVVNEEVQRARIATQILPVIGPEDRTAVSFSDFRMTFGNSNLPPPPPQRLDVSSVPDHPLTTIQVPVQLSSSEMGDAALEAALVKFRRAANIVARIEDAVVFTDRPIPGPPLVGVAGIPLVYRVTGGGPRPGQLFELGLLPVDAAGPASPLDTRPLVVVNPPPLQLPGLWPLPPGNAVGEQVTTAVIQALLALEANGHSGPFACALCPYFYEAVYTPNANLLMAKDRILPILNGPLVRSSAMNDYPFPYGVVIALGGSQVGLRVTSDINVKYVQATSEPRYLFRVSERLGLRVSDPSAIAVLTI